MADGERYSVFVAGSPALSPPYLATDEIAVVRNGVTYKIPPTNLPTSGSYVYAAPLTGVTLTAVAGQGAYVLNPAGAIAALTIVMPPSAADAQVFEVSTTQTITSLTLTPAATQAMGGTSGGPFVLSANGGVSWRYRSVDLTWYPRA